MAKSVLLRRKGDIVAASAVYRCDVSWRGEEVATTPSWHWHNVWSTNGLKVYTIAHSGGIVAASLVTAAVEAINVSSTN